MTATVKLFSSWFCPFAQRAWLALLEKGVEFEYNEIDPYNKTKEFLTINPRGLVPVIVNDGKCVYESAVCIEYVDEAWPDGPSLLPKDPYERAQARIWADFITKKIVPKFYMALQRQTRPEQEEAMEAILTALIELSGAMSTEGPFFGGQNFGLVDIMLVPFTIRFEILSHYRSFAVPQTDTFARFRRWMEACHARDSVKATLSTKEKYIAIYKRYENNSAQTEVADAIRKGTTLP
ncbi:glutathione S-transferase U20-like [Haliotis rubra]|uniref:glutathione S-transferase U20-like n=1 Tax=Haliotis rubra TaxID=36100 RepID=UPI001EE5EB4B|nr:glutathione S-transferase U20-like [Haliotis rubra]